MKAVNLEKLLPADIPAGERDALVRQARWISLARRAYRADFVSVYFAALTIWNLYSAAGDSGGPPPRGWLRRRSVSGPRPWRSWRCSATFPRARRSTS